MFESLGVTERTLAVYRALLLRPQRMEQPPAELSAGLGAQVGIAADAAAAEIHHLRDLGLIVPRWNAVDQEYPVEPGVGFELLAALQKEEIERLSKQLRLDETGAKGFTAEYKEFLIGKTARDVEVLEGREAAYQRIQQFRQQKSSLAMLPPDGINVRPPEESPDNRFLDRGVDARWLLAESQLKIREIREYCRWVISRGGKVRTAPSIPMKLLIFDGESAVMGIDPDDTSVGAVVHHSTAVVRLATEFFEYYWRHGADPFAEQPAATGGLTPQELEFLQLLVRGATDEQAGRKLGVSLRTVRRMAAKLSEQAGASGRFELGVRAAQRGWVR